MHVRAELLDSNGDHVSGYFAYTDPKTDELTPALKWSIEQLLKDVALNDGATIVLSKWDGDEDDNDCEG